MALSTDSILILCFIFAMFELFLWAIYPTSVEIFHITGFFIVFFYLVVKEIKNQRWEYIVFYIFLSPFIAFLWFVYVPFELREQYQWYNFSKNGIDYIINYEDSELNIDKMMESINNQEFLQEIAIKAHKYSFRATAMKLIKGKDFLKTTALSNENESTRRFAIYRYRELFGHDDEILKELILKYPHCSDNHEYELTIKDADILESLLPYLTDLVKDRREDPSYIEETKKRIEKLRYDNQWGN